MPEKPKFKGLQVEEKTLEKFRKIKKKTGEMVYRIADRLADEELRKLETEKSK